MLARSRTISVWILLAALCAIALALFFYRQHAIVERLEEDVLFTVNPTAGRAYAYGLAHFSAMTPDEYDVARADYFFQKALAIDPSYPMVHFQLSRIAFLRGKFTEALSLVNQEFVINPKPEPNIYYLRALIEGYMGNYADAEKDYESYFKAAPANWPGINDYSWVLLKDNRPADADYALSWGLKQWPENAWLLSNDATALYEMGDYKAAAAQAEKAEAAVQSVTVADWLIAYPGNDPLVAEQGLQNFKQGTEENLQKILAKAQ